MNKNDDLVRRKIELWFFRGMSDEQRLSLFGIFGMPTHEITDHGRQRIALRHVLSSLAIERGAAQGIVTDEMVVDAAGRLIMALPSHAVDAVNSSDILFLDVAREVLGVAFIAAPPAPQAADTRPGAANGSLRGERQALATPPAPAADAEESFANCYVCGRIVDTREQSEGGDPFGAEDNQGWTCSIECWETTLGEDDPTPQQPAVEAEAVEDWPSWAREIYAFLKERGYYESQFDEVDLPEDFHDWLLGFEESSEAALKAKTDEIERLTKKLAVTRQEADCMREQSIENSRLHNAAEASNKALREGLKEALQKADEVRADAYRNKGAASYREPAVEAVIQKEIDRVIHLFRALLSETGSE